MITPQERALKTPYFTTEEYNETQSKNMLQQLRERHGPMPSSMSSNHAPSTQSQADHFIGETKPHFSKHTKKSAGSSCDDDVDDELSPNERIVFGFSDRLQGSGMVGREISKSNGFK